MIDVAAIRARNEGRFGLHVKFFASPPTEEDVLRDPRNAAVDIRELLAEVERLMERIRRMES